MPRRYCIAPRRDWHCRSKEKAVEIVKIEKEKTLRLQEEEKKQGIADAATETAKKQGEAELAHKRATEVVETKVANEKEKINTSQFRQHGRKC